MLLFMVPAFLQDKLDCNIQINVDDVSIAHGEDGAIRFDLKVNGSVDESIISRFT